MPQRCALIALSAYQLAESDLARPLAVVSALPYAEDILSGCRSWLSPEAVGPGWACHSNLLRAGRPLGLEESQPTPPRLLLLESKLYTQPKPRLANGGDLLGRGDFAAWAIAVDARRMSQSPSCRVQLPIRPNHLFNPHGCLRGTIRNAGCGTRNPNKMTLNGQGVHSERWGARSENHYNSGLPLRRCSGSRRLKC